MVKTTIGIDGNEANMESRAGVHQYAFELLWAIFNRLKTGNANDLDFLIYLKEKPSKDLPPEDHGWRYTILPKSSLWIMFRLMPHLLVKREVNVFFSPNHYLPLITAMPMVCTIHDLGYLKFSGQFRKTDFWQLTVWTAISLIVSKKIIAVSEFTSRDIVRHYTFTSKKVAVVLHGYDANRFNVKVLPSVVRRVRQTYNLTGKYFLFLGTLKPSKNIEGIVDAMALVLTKYYKSGDVKLVVAGQKGWLYESIFKKVKDLNLSDHVVFTDYVPEQDKPALIAGSTALVSPSYWEGFGMHVLEAMACGKPVIVSKEASLPEVAGAAGLYVDPSKPEEIAEVMAKVLKMTKAEYNTVSVNCLMQARTFSWDKCAQETLAVLEKARK